MGIYKTHKKNIEVRKAQGWPLALLINQKAEWCEERSHDYPNPPQNIQNSSEIIKIRRMFKKFADTLCLEV